LPFRPGATNSKRELPSQEYIEASRTLDARQESLTREKTEVMERMRVQGLREDVAASVRRFCAAARAQFEGCFAGKRSSCVTISRRSFSTTAG
jgi:hypothetical protein